MAHLLRIDSSARLEGSHSRALADFFQQTWLERHPADQVVVRDVTQPAIPHIENLAIAGFQTPTEQHTDAMKTAVALSDSLIAELKRADVLLMSVPMYNFSVPSALKAWIDQIVRQGQTFSMDATGFAGLLTTKQAFIVSAAGGAGYGKGGPAEALNFVEPYLRGLLTFLGIPEVHYFTAEGMMDRANQAAILEQTKAEILAAIA